MMTLLFLDKVDKHYRPLHKHKNAFCLKAIFPFIFFILILFSNFQGYAQTSLPSASDGGFENSTSTFAANGWAVANGWLGSAWNVGTAAGAYSGTKSAFFGPDNTSYSGSGSATVVHFYRDVVVPSGATGITLSFKLKYPIVDDDYDFFDVFTTTTSHTPTAGIDPYWDWGYTNVFENTSVQYNSFTPLTFSLPNSLAGTTVRLVFSFSNDGYSPYSAPAVDNISLTYTSCTSPTLTYTSTSSCVGGSTGTITGTGSGGSTPYSYSLDGVSYQSANTFSGLAAGNYTLYVKSSGGCVASTPVSISQYSASTGNQNAAGTNSWIGHAYDGTNFSTYVGTFSQSETFDQNFGGNTTCFPVTSSAGASSIYTETFSVRYRMNSSKNGLYVVDLGSDDGGRLTVDGTLIYNDWGDHGFNINSRILINLKGNSSLNYEFYENGGGNEVAFQNLTLVLANTLSNYTSQTICLGGSGTSISGDVYGALPGGIALSGTTGYQWAYSTSLGGTKTNISGATGATFTPNTSTAPFNVAGTYYVYRKATVTSTNNFGVGSYTATNESNAATVTVNATPSAPTVTTPVTYCQNATATALSATGSNLFWGSSSISGVAGGTGNISSSIPAYVDNSYSNQKTNFTTTVPNVKITSVNYTLPLYQNVTGLRLALFDNAGNKIATSSTTTSQTANFTSLQITNIFNYTLPAAGNYSIGIDAGLGNIGGDNPSFPITESSGTIKITGKSGTYRCFNNIQFTVNSGGSAPTPSTAAVGTTNYTVTQTVNGCTSPSANISVIVTTPPSATISYGASPYCTSAGTASVTLLGTTGGTFSSDAGLKINASTGSVDLATSSQGTHTVTYTVSAANGCSAFSTTTTITVTTQPHASGFYPANPYCSNIGTLYPTGSQQGKMGTLSAAPAGLSINSATGIINVANSTPGSYTVTYSVPAYGGCGSYSASAPVIISTAPSASINYNGSPYCTGSGTASVSLTGTSGGTFSSTTGLSINSSTGVVDLVNSTPGSYTVTYTIAPSNGCATYTTTTNITITPKVSSLVFTAGASSVRCQGAGTVIYAATANNSTGISYSLDAISLAAGNTINSSTGAVTFVAGWKGTSSIKAVASGCTPLSATHTVTTSPTPSGSISTTYTCIDGSSATITTTGNTGISPFTYSLNSGTFQSSGMFTGLSAGNYSIQIKSDDGCIYSTPATVNPYPNSSGDQSAAGANTWIGHMYNGQNFDAYKGYFSESEIFDESFGGSGTCFPITSNVSGSTIYTDQFSVKFKMNSTRKGLYVVDLGSDDGSRLTVNGELVFNDWNDHAFAGRPRVLMNLDGNSSLTYEFYENGGDNRILFNNLTLVLENNLSSNITQSICMGNSGTAIGGDVFGTLPSGVSKYGSTGYQWTYSTTAGGTRSNISGATGATFTPNTSTAPFNVPGTYYVYRNAVLSSVNNTGKSPYMATNVSNVATIIINAIPSATISYANAPFCSTSSMSEKVTLTGASGGTFSAPGLVINSVTGDIVPNANSIGSYTINYLIGATGGCSSFSTSTEIYIGAAGTWSGKMDNEWNNSANWICGIIPDCTIDVTIPKQVFNFPSVVTHYAEAKNLNIENGASLAISGTIRIGGAINNSGNLDIINGTLEMTGKTAQSIAGSMFTNQTIKNLIVNNTSAAGLSVSSALHDTLKLTGILSFGNSNSILNTGDNITLISNYDGTASVSIVGNHNAINGKVIVEKYINTGTTSGQHGKSWQFLSVATLGQTIKESWMENKNEVSGYGTTMSGPGGVAAGFDLASAAPSIKYFSDVVNNWKGITDANELIANTQGYMVFVRGDRTVTSPTQVANTTVLRSKGTLFIGDQLPIKVKPGKFQSIGNPYASAIDFSLIRKDTVIDDAFYVYDPYLYGTYGVGGYQTLSSVNNWKPVPGGTSAYPGTVLSSIIQSGQAFFVHSHSSSEAGSVSFTEDCKSATSRPGHSSRLAEKVEGTQRQFLRASLITNTGLMADGNVVAFDKSYRDEIDGNDALKISNSGENFSVKSAGKLLTIEAKRPVSDSDTLYYNISNLSKTDYQLAFAPENMGNVGLQAYLVDKFLNTETPVSLSDSTFIKIAVTSGAGSAAADRFKVVFRQMKSLPVTLTSSHATPQNQNVVVNWKTENESGMLQYEVQRSPDGNIFQTSSVTPALNKGSGNYQWTDSQSLEGNNYYRIKIVSKDGKVSYSPVMKVNMGKMIAAMEVAPNPILNGTIHLVFRNEPPGKYTISLSNQLGQVILLRTILHTAESASASISANSISKGIYNLLIVKPDGNNETVKIFIN